ncbi:Uncharacterised protein [Mycobacteroides abscessus subsp. abscessus]|uniref:hypothetical protein n=1 Tax=Mycobacteroides abscessus TaxID=36809 RepID=UPI000926F939|nr:hypothetical protein [Mycobacteroides abscessus]SIJ21503.1 Uncharacterised protein [Mycobacteroides abscessus subsp. abscessus]SLH38996.1 Uncharacterised protein [Mycobacteroides abscessus subsp. abscessus]
MFDSVPLQCAPFDITCTARGVISDALINAVRLALILILAVLALAFLAALTWWLNRYTPMLLAALAARRAEQPEHPSVRRPGLPTALPPPPKPPSPAQIADRQHLT